MADEWLTFEQAGHLIDGASGWQSSADGARQSAQTLLMLAHKGMVGATARIWTCATDLSDVGKNRSANARERADFLLMLFARERCKADSWNSVPTPTISVHAAFSIADDGTGNFDAVRAMREAGQVKAQTFTVVGLRFNRSDIAKAFAIVETSAKKLGRPKNRGGWVAQDAPIIELMRTMIEETPGMTRYGAAQHFIAQAPGNAGDETKRKRLSDLYRKTYPD